jgi:hypothetical protein
MYGIGNWAEVAEHVATKTKAQCYDHYMLAYMDSPYSPLPVEDLKVLPSETIRLLCNVVQFNLFTHWIGYGTSSWEVKIRTLSHDKDT